eukprot:9915528-Prorocentrum_lima.AAC.1
MELSTLLLIEMWIGGLSHERGSHPKFCDVESYHDPENQHTLSRHVGTHLDIMQGVVAQEVGE